MNMLLQKYQDHEEQAETAAKRKEYSVAAFHLTKAAAFAIELAKVSSGPVSERYLQDAHAKMDIAEKLGSKSTRANSLDAVPTIAPNSEDAASSFLLSERPTLRMSDVVGMDALKTRIDEIVIKPYQYPEKYKKAGLDSNSGGVLLYGPPGTGKTFIARALAGELDVPFFNVDPSQLVDKYIGETPKKIASLFSEVRKHPRSIVFIDEVTQLLGQNEANEKTGGIEQMFRETDGLMKTSHGFLLLMATNYPWKLPKPMLRQGRTRDAIYIGLPDRPARFAMLNYHAKGRRLAPDVDLNQLAELLEGYSSAEVAGLVRRAKEKSLLREIQTSTDDEPVSAQDVQIALKEVRPASTKADIDRYVAWGTENFAE